MRYGMTKGDNETDCPICRQRVPINREGKIVMHVTETKTRIGKYRKECDGSGRKVR